MNLRSENSLSISNFIKYHKTLDRELWEFYFIPQCNILSFFSSEIILFYSIPINYCSADYNAAIGRCYKDYHRSFRENPSSEYTCEKFHFARTCASSVRSRMCYYSNVLDQIHKMTETLTRSVAQYYIHRLLSIPSSERIIIHY